MYLGEHDGGKSKHEIEDHHLSHLSSIKAIDAEEARSSLLYSYKNSFNGYAAVLTPDEASRLSGGYSSYKDFFFSSLSYSLEVRVVPSVECSKSDWSGSPL